MNERQPGHKVLILTGDEVSTILAALMEIPAKFSYDLIFTIREQVSQAETNEKQQS